MSPAKPSQSIEELEKSIDATLSQYRSSFNSPSPSSSVSHKANNEDALSSNAYYSRLETFRTETYFAKPLCLSPLNCAAFGWQNSEADIIQCPQCNSAICIAFHPNLNKVSYDDLTQQYFNMLATSHEFGCIFRKYVERWLKIMKRLDKLTDDGAESQVVASETDYPDLPKPQLTRVYVPPYFLSLSTQFLVFEDASKDGSVTFCNIQELATAISEEVKSQYDVSISDALADYCQIPTSLKGAQTANLLATFGWHISKTNSDDNNTCVQCKICLSRAILPSRKRRFSEVKVNNDMDEVKLHLIQSHRVYCPYVGGFSHKGEPGWRVIVKNLVKFAKKEIGDDGVVKLDDLWGQEKARKKATKIL